MDIQVGDRVTYKSINEPDYQVRPKIIINEDDIIKIHSCIKENQIKILKIERPKYEVVEENKELLTKQEKEFLKLYMQFTNIITNTIYKKDGFINFIGYTVELALYKGFDKLVENKLYTLKELGLEEN